MKMSSYEVVCRAVEFHKPDRLPVQFDVFGLNDFHHVKWNQIGVGDKKLPYTLDEWGCGWQRTETPNMGQVKYHPLAAQTDLSSYSWPDPDAEAFY